jgi:NADPH:quinone reductase-like Zn-dependent oxidoreductase
VNFGNHEPRETIHGREKYKWVLLMFLFAAFFLELGSRQLYNAALPQIRLEFLRFGVADAQLGAVGAVFAPFVHKVMPIAEVAEAQAILERGKNRGKVVLLV